jgi:hypothetical protein
MRWQRLTALMLSVLALSVLAVGMFAAPSGLAWG